MSFFETIVSRITRPNKALGIHLDLNSDTKSIRVIELGRKKGELLLGDIQVFHSIEELAAAFPKESIAGVRLTGKGILSKTFDSPLQKDEILFKVLPNANQNDFYCQHFVSNNTTYASIIRKDVLDDLLSKLDHFFISSLELGSESDLPLTEILELPSKEQTVQVGTKELHYSDLGAFSSAFKSLLDFDEGTLELSEVERQKEEYHFKQLFQLGGAFTLGLALIVLLANFILFQSYRSANQELAHEAAKYESINSRKDSLANVLNQREAFLSSSGWLKSIPLSKLADEMGACMPEQLLLSIINIYPYDEKKSRESRKNEFEVKQVVIEGKTTNTVELNHWVNKLAKLGTINSTEIIAYEYDSREKVGAFKLAIQLK